MPDYATPPDHTSKDNTTVAWKIGPCTTLWCWPVDINPNRWAVDIDTGRPYPDHQTHHDVSEAKALQILEHLGMARALAVEVDG